MSGAGKDREARLSSLAGDVFRAAVRKDAGAVGRGLADIEELGVDWVMVARMFTSPVHEVLKAAAHSVGGELVEVMPTLDPEVEREAPANAFVHRFVAAAFNNDDALCNDLFKAFADAHWDEETHGESSAVLAVLVGVAMQFTAAGGEVK